MLYVEATQSGGEAHWSRSGSSASRFRSSCSFRASHSRLVTLSAAPLAAVRPFAMPLTPLAAPASLGPAPGEPSRPVAVVLST